MRFDNNGVSPLILDVTDKAKAQINRAVQWVKSQNPGQEDAAADHFSAKVADALADLCEDLAWRLTTRNNLPVPDETISILFARPAFPHYITVTKSGKRARRSSASTWRAYYALTDSDHDGKVDTLTVLLFLHAAAHLPTFGDTIDEETA